MAREQRGRSFGIEDGRFDARRCRERGFIRASLVATLAFMALLGLGYPLAVTGICQVLFSRAANGSLLTGRDGVDGSALIGQTFTQPGEFWGRPSSAGKGYDPQASGPSNLSPTSQRLADQLEAEADKARADGVTGSIPVDRLTGSGSGLDPDISVDNALGQVPRVARALDLPEARIEALVRSHVTGRDLGLFGEPRVNVALLNRDLKHNP